MRYSAYAWRPMSGIQQNQQQKPGLRMVAVTTRFRIFAEERPDIAFDWTNNAGEESGGGNVMEKPKTLAQR